MFPVQSFVEIKLFLRSVKRKSHFTIKTQSDKSIIVYEIMNVKESQMTNTFICNFCFIFQWCNTPFCAINEEFKYISHLENQHLSIKHH